MNDTGFDQPRPKTDETTHPEDMGINVVETVRVFKEQEQEQGLLDQIDLQMVVGSSGSILEGLITPQTRAVKDLDTVTVVGSDAVAERVRRFMDKKRDELTLCHETSDVFVAAPLTGMVGEWAKDNGTYPIYNIQHMLTWARPHIIRMSDHFRNDVIRSACAEILSDSQIAELPDSYLVSAASIGGLLEADFRHLSTQQVMEIVDIATQYKTDYYLGKHDDYGVKTAISIPRNLLYGQLWTKLSEYGVEGFH